MSHHTEFAKKRKHDAHVDEAEYQAQAQQQRIEDAYAARTKFLDILKDDRIVVPNDLTPRVLENVGNLSQIDLDAAIEAGFRADPQILHPKVLRSVFFRSMDPYNSFDRRHWQTRCTILHLRFGMADPALVRGGAEYGLTDLPQWAASNKGKFMILVGQLDASFEAARSNPVNTAQQALALLGEPMTQESEVQAMTDAFELLAANVRREFDEGDLAKKMRMLHLAKNGP
ncbi:hypothetical protein Tdes44962_MAKER02225 [Teratosphaeria destructans]|uniref:Uncharacterized protein n=1 Tax=Teratosphaeria destructans TaxID=418781 RepID=A0A9W7SUS0_9PEZI|nr:hypothetical protein Tdes44962_MAKER02225 [Teratosphaeria destructans]